jgi:hypothetical protein
MISLVKDVWDWLTKQALLQLLVLLVIAFCLLLLNIKYPLSFERSRVEVRNLVEIDETTKYVVRTVVSEKGAKVELKTTSYYSEVKKSENCTKSE